MKIYRLTIFVLLILALSCSSKKNSLGFDDEIRVVCSQLDEPLVRGYLSSIFNDTLFTPQPEPAYKLIFNRPSDFNDLKKYAHLIIVAVNRNDSNSGFRLIKKLLPERQSYNFKDDNPLYLDRDLYAKDQVFVVINALDEDHLNYQFNRNKELLHAHFDQQFNNRTNRFLFKHSQEDEENKLKTDFSWNIEVPWGWEVLKRDGKKNLFWMGAEYPYRWLSVHWEKGNIIADQLIVGEKLWKSSESHFESISFNEFKFNLEKIYFNRFPGWRCTGIWSSIDSLEAKGGPFQSFIFYDNKSDRTFHINTLVYNPGKNKATYIRQLEYIAKSIKTSFD